jgi:hypothetical protein
MNSRPVRLLAAALFLLAVPPPATAQDAAATAESANSAIHQAETARRAAAEAGAEWLETGKMIDKARQAADDGDFEQAAALAEKARQQGELAVAQAQREAEAWQQRVIR